MKKLFYLFGGMLIFTSFTCDPEFTETIILSNKTSKTIFLRLEPDTLRQASEPGYINNINRSMEVEEYLVGNKVVSVEIKILPGKDFRFFMSYSSDEGILLDRTSSMEVLRDMYDTLVVKTPFLNKDLHDLMNWRHMSRYNEDGTAKVDQKFVFDVFRGDIF